MADSSYKDALETDEERVILMVHDIKPPFLDGRIVFTTQTDAVQVVRDPNGDFAQLCKKGSQILKFIREREDKTKMREKFWELAGSRMGNLLQINKQAEKEETQIVNDNKIEEDDEVDYKAESQYGAALKKKH